MGVCARPTADAQFPLTNPQGPGESMIETASQTLGVPADLLRIAICIVGSFPLGVYVSRMPRAKAHLKDVLIVTVGVFYLAGLFRLYGGVLLLLGTSLVTYALVWAFQSAPWMPWLNFGAQMLFMLLSHCREQFSGADFVNQIGITGSQMILVQKLTAFAWDCHDGTLQPEKLRNEHERSKRVVVLPSVLRFLSFVFFFPTIMTGPACAFADYSAWVDGHVEAQLRAEPHGEAARGRRGAVLRRLLPGLLWAGLYMLTSNWIPYDHMFEQRWYLDRPLAARIFLVYAAGLIYRTKYYCAWLLSETACVCCGISYSGDGKWDAMTNVYPLRVELSQNFYEVFGNWNIITSDWLRYYVYVRVTPRGHKPGIRATFATFLVSALWHGTRPGYYLTFVTAAMLQTFGKVYRRSFRPLVADTPLKPVYDIVSLVITQASLGFCAYPFILLNLRPAFLAWKSLYFFVFVGMALSWPVAGRARALIKARTGPDSKTKKKTS